MTKFAYLCFILLMNGTCLAAHQADDHNPSLIVQTTNHSQNAVCSWMEEKSAAPQQQAAKLPKRRWIRYNQKIHRWFFRSCKFNHDLR